MRDQDTGKLLLEDEKDELEAVLASSLFVRTPSLANLLSYLCQKYFQGEADLLKEYTIGVEAFGRAPDFDKKEDSIVRVEIRRLREKLRQYYETEGADHPIRLTIPVGHYVPVFTKNGAEPLQSRPDTPEPAEAQDSLPAKRVIEVIQGQVMACPDNLERDLYGFTMLDSVKAIMQLSSFDYLKVYGWSTERALIFSSVEYGRSPMVAIRAHPLKPAVVVFHKPGQIDPLAIKLAELERIPLVRTDMAQEQILGELGRL